MIRNIHPDMLAAAVERIRRVARQQGPRRGLTPPRVLPVHTLLVPAERLQANSALYVGRAAMYMVHTYASDCVVLWRALRLPGWEALPTESARVDELLLRLDAGDAELATRWPEAVLAHEVYRRTMHRLNHRPVQDLRIDFQDTVTLSDAEVDAIAVGVVDCLRQDISADVLPAKLGIRIGSLQPGAAERTLRVLDVVLSELAVRVEVPDGLMISVTGVTSPEAVGVLVQMLAHLEQQCTLRKGSLRLELAIDRAECVLSEDGRIRLRELLSAARGRCDAVWIHTDALAHRYGVGVAHLVRDLACLAVAGTPVQISAGLSEPMPSFTHGEISTSAQRSEQFAEVHTLWRGEARRILDQLEAGVPWGWDVDPGKLPVRLAATMAHGRLTWASRMRELARALRAALAEPAASPEVLVEGQAHLEAVLRWLDCGALGEAELDAAGLDAQDIASRSFQVIMDRRRS
ncbi:MAG TPA: hypothetical protein ENK18_15435 [Deltaproteobacteria bacterium]|nr:hypothetical protein [Deltaproteobacteria bacterium]